MGIWRYCATKGVKFVHGEQAGKVVELVYSKETPSKCTGVKTADGRSHPADLTICALGAHGATLLPELGKFNTARCWSVAHVQLTEEETNLLRGIPTTNVRDLGFFFEPDPKTRLFKICPLGTGYTNTNRETGVSLPPSDQLPAPQDFIPREDELKLPEENKKVIKQPTLYILATKDMILTKEMSLGMEKAIPNLTRAEVPAGHWALWHTPDETNRILKDWLEGVVLGG